MTSAEMGLILMTRVGPSGTELSNTDANYLLEALRRDWSVRVLDAACRGNKSWSVFQQCDDPFFSEYGVQIVVEGMAEDPPVWVGATHEAARLAAAEAVWPELPESVRAELGERP